MHKADARAFLQQMLGPAADFRDGQWEAIDLAANRRERLLVVQRTGWGKSVVYFLAAKILRDVGAGPTLLISPLLSLMRNQILAAEKLGIRAVTIHSQNVEEWTQVEAALGANEVDLLMISPERLANPDFFNRLLPLIRRSIGMFVVDEAHCISDWGHDFRPDYRRIVRILRLLPAGVPIICTTATANDRVVRDIESQIEDLHIRRGPLVRPSLKLFNVNWKTRPTAWRGWLTSCPNFPATESSTLSPFRTLAGSPDFSRAAALRRGLTTPIWRLPNASRPSSTCSITVSKRWWLRLRWGWASTNRTSVSSFTFSGPGRLSRTINRLAALVAQWIQPTGFS